MQRKAVAVVALVLAVVYAGLLGMGAYLQYESGRLFDQMWTSEEGRALEAEYRQTAWRSEQLKWCGGALGYLAVATGVWLVLAKRMKAREYGVSVGSALILGVLATLPWWLKSGDNAGDYYVQQLFLVLAGMGGGVIAALSRAAGDGQRAELTENDREKNGGFQQKTAQRLRRHRALLCFRVAGRSGVPRSSRRCMTGRRPAANIRPMERGRDTKGPVVHGSGPAQPGPKRDETMGRCGRRGSGWAPNGGTGVAVAACNAQECCGLHRSFGRSPAVKGWRAEREHPCGQMQQMIRYRKKIAA